MRNLIFVPATEQAFLDAIAVQTANSTRQVRIETASPLGQSVARVARASFSNAVLDGEAPIEVVCETDSERLAAALIKFVDRPDVTVIAPITDRFWSQRSLYLISIPKSGTHLLMELARALGYGNGEESPPLPHRATWHYLEFTNSHTAAPDFFIDTVRRRPHGNRDHTFPHHPALFIYRNPLDIVASEANYYQEDGATIFAGYLDGLSYEERLLRLIDDPWLMGSLRDRVGKFAAWLEFGSVIPVSFEELVGPQGGGDASIQETLIWSLMLRLQVPGKPADIATKVFNPNSPTFRFGKIGGHVKKLTPRAWQKLSSLKQDYMEVYGFGEKPASGPWLSSRAGEFLHRVPRYSKIDPGATPFVARTKYLNHAIVRFRGTYFAIPEGFPNGDLLKAPPEVLQTLPQAPDLDTLEFLVHSRVFMEFTKNRAKPAG